MTIARPDCHVLTDLPFSLDIDSIVRNSGMDSSMFEPAEIECVVTRLREIARPKAMYRQSRVEERGDDFVRVDGIVFTSKVLRKNLDKVDTVFAFVASCGVEPDTIALDPDDYLMRFFLDSAKAALLGFAAEGLVAHLRREYALALSACMSPGSGDMQVWPIEQQRLLFSLVGDVERAIGVRLTETSLMIPNKSLSGIRYASEKEFHECQVCHRENCPSRSAPFDKALYASVMQGTLKECGAAGE